MLRAVLIVVLASAPAQAAGPAAGLGAAQLSSAAADPAGGEWSDGPSYRVSLPSVEDGESSWPPSPLEEGAKYEGFEKGFAIGFSAVEWVPNWIAKNVPLGGILGLALGIGLAPLGLVVGIIGGLVTWIASLF